MKIQRSLIARLLRFAADLIDPRSSIFSRRDPRRHDPGPE